MKKRILSLFLALVLCLSLLPASAFAAEPNVTESGAGTANEEKENETIVHEGCMSDNSGIGSGSGSTGGLLVEDGNTQPGGGLVVPAEQNGSGSAEAKIGDTEYDTLADALSEMSEDEIILLTDVTATEELSVDVSTTINMDGHSITGNIAVNDSLTLKNGTVTGKVTVDATEGTFTMTAPADAAAAIDGGLEVNSGSCSVSGAQIGVKGTLYFGGTSMSISGTEKAVELTAAAGPTNLTLYGSAAETGDTSTEAAFADGTYKVGGEIAKKLSSTKTGSTEEPKPEAKLTLDRETANAKAGETVTFTVTYTGTKELEAYIQKNALDENFEVCLTDNGNGTYTLTVKIDAETPTGDYKLFVHEKNNAAVQAEVTIHVTGKEPVAEVIRAGESVGTYTSLPTALDKAQNGDTVKMLANHVTDWVAVDAGDESTLAVVTKKLTLDLSGKTVDYLIVGEMEVDEENQTITATYPGNLTVVSNGGGATAAGTINALDFVKGSLEIQSGQIGYSGGGGLTCNEDSGSVTISGGTVLGLTVGVGASVTVSGGSLHAGSWFIYDTLNITGGTFNNVSFNNRGGTIAISGGTFGTITNRNESTIIPPMSLLANGHAFYDQYESYGVKDGSQVDSLRNVTVKEHTHTMGEDNKCACGLSCTHKTTDGTSAIGEDGKCTLCGTQFAAAIGETYYTDVKSALDAALDGQTVKLLTNRMLSDGTYVSKTLTLDLNGHSLSGYSLKVDSLTATSQVLTGKLMVIDSSGGNGTVGVAVRNGGTLVFDPENDSTTLLQLEVWGGTVELFGGKILRDGLRLNNNIALGDLLPAGKGFAYYNGDTRLTLKEAASQTCNLVVKACDHNGTNGFDINALTCPYCGAPAVAQTALTGVSGNPWRNFADLQTAIDADRDGGAEFKLLADVTGNYTIDGTQDTGISLGDYVIDGTVTIKAATDKHNSVSFSSNRSDISITKMIAEKGAKLYSTEQDTEEGTFNAIIGTLELADTTNWADILYVPEQYGYKQYTEYPNLTEYKWYAPAEVEAAALTNVVVKRLPITSKNLSITKVSDGSTVYRTVERGTATLLRAYCNTSATDVDVKFYIGEVGSTGEIQYAQVPATERRKIGTNYYYVLEYTFNKMVDYKIYFTASKDNYSVTSGDKKLTVTKASIPTEAITAPTANTLTYTGSAQELVTPGKLDAQYGTIKYSLSRSSSSFSTEIPTKTDAGTYTVYYKVYGNDDYNDVNRTYNLSVTISPMKIDHVMFSKDISKTYDGSAEFDLVPADKASYLTFYDAHNLPTTVPADAYEISNMRFLAKTEDGTLVDSPEAGSKSWITFTVKLTSKNYVLQVSDADEPASELTYNQSGGAKFTIEQAVIDLSSNRFEQFVYNDLAKTYEIALRPMLDALLSRQPDGCTYGAINYKAPYSVGFTNGYGVYNGGVPRLYGNTGILNLPIAAANKTTGEIGAARVTIETTNYQSFQLVIYIMAKNKIVPVLDGEVSTTEITYGQLLNECTITGKMKDPNTGTEVPGTFAWTDGTLKLNAGSPKADWTFTPNSEEYATVTGKTTVKVNPKSIEGAIVTLEEDSFVYDGTEKDPKIASVVLDGVALIYDGRNGDYGFSYNRTSEVGIYNDFSIGGTNNYTGEIKITWSITPREVTPTIAVASCSYTGDPLEPTVTLTDDLGNTIDPKEYTVTYSNNTNAGKGLVTIKDVDGGNYVINEKSQDFLITKATAPTNLQHGMLNVVNGTSRTYTYDFSQLLPALSKGEYGTVSYEYVGVTGLKTGYEVDGTVQLDETTGALTLPFTAARHKLGQVTGMVGTICVDVTTKNFEIFQLTLTLNAIDQIKPEPDGTITASEITYGDKLSESTISGKMKDPNTGTEVKGTFTWNTPDATPDAGGHYPEWTFTPAEGYEEYAPTTGTVTIKVNKAQLTDVSVAQDGALTYTGQPQTANVKTTATALDGDSVTFCYGKTKDGPYDTMVPAFTDAGDYIVYYYADNDNYERVSGTFTVTIAPMTLYAARVDALSKSYDGTAAVEIPTGKVKYVDGMTPDGIVLPDGAFAITNARFTMRQADGETYLLSPEAGNGKALSFHLKLTSKNYVLYKNETGEADYDTMTSDPDTYQITKAPAPSATPVNQYVFNDLARTYEIDLSKYLPELTSPRTYGSISYTIDPNTVTFYADYYDEGSAAMENGILRLPIKKASTMSSGAAVVTLTVQVTSTNYAPFDLYVGATLKDKTEPKVDTISASGITFGGTLKDSSISGRMIDPNTKEEVEGTFTWKDSTTKPAASGDFQAEWVFTPTKPEYAPAAGTVTVKVATAPILEALVSEEPSYTYDGSTHTPGNITVKLTDGTTLEENKDYTISAEAKTDAGTYQFTINGIGNYHGSKEKQLWRITPRTVENPTLTVEDGVYNGGEAVKPTITVKDDLGNTIDPKEYDVSYSDNTNAGHGTVTITDKTGGNYVLGTASQTFTIGKAAGGSLGTAEGQQKYSHTQDFTYTPDWSKLPKTQTWNYGSTYSVSSGSNATLTTNDISADGQKLTYAISGGKAGDVITITLKASCNNYEDFTITLTITLTARDDQKPLTITGAGSVVYGQTLTLTTTGGSGTGAVTYRIDTAHSTGEATIDPNTGVLTPVKVGSVSVIATKAGGNDYNDVTSAPFVLMIKPATPTGEPNYTKITTGGKTLKDAALTTEGSTLNPSDGKLEWVDDKGNVLPDNTRVEANTTYKWRFTPDDDNYTALTGEVELYHKSSSGGGGSSGYSYYTIKATAGAGGSISPAGNVSVREGRDQTFTITPDKGYAVSNVKIDGKSIGAVKSYTFENVRRTHTIEVIFMKANGNPQTGVFVDVATGSYYEDAVDWAVENGITKGTDDTHFSPDGICTRAQAVTFLWRATGSPEPETRAMPFTDVPAGSYYYDAVLWAVENGITKGTSDTTFSPNMTCSRAQIVAFLWRSEKSPAAGTANPFADVKSTAYYADAVLWAVKENITKGTTNTTFSPDADCTRAQIVTFLWRCKK